MAVKSRRVRAALLLLAATAATPAAAQFNFNDVTSQLTTLAKDSGNLYLVALNALPDVKKQVYSVIQTAIDDTNAFLEKFKNPELVNAYGRSPAVYPSRKSAMSDCTVGVGGTPDWSDAYDKAKALVAKMTDLEKASITLGDLQMNGCSGFIGSVKRLDFPGICLNDAENGVRGGELVNGYASQISVGASWNTYLAYKRAHYIGKEFKAKGVNVLLGPVVGPLGRVALGGRNWEGFSSDPYLSGKLVYPTILGMQESVTACVKHFIANEQETARQPFLLGFVGPLGNQSVSSNLDDRTMHEAYLWPFYDAVRAEVGSVMCSYNRVNGSHACQNSKLLNGLLKTELGFQGFVVSDWYATHTGVASNNAGLDVVMPTSQQFNPVTLSLAVVNGSIARSRLDDQATRLLAAWFRYSSGVSPGLTNSSTIDARDPAAEDTILQSAIEAQVLVKNENRALPLNKPATLNLFGYDGISGTNKTSDGGGLGAVSLQGTQAYPNGKSFGIIDYGLISAEVVDEAGPPIALNSTMLIGGGSGGITPNSSVSPFDAFQQQAALDKTTLHYDFNSTKPTVQSPEAPCIVFINAQSGEGWDRVSLSDTYSDDLVKHVASQCANTMVVIHNAGIRVVDAWIDDPNITAVIFAHLPGQASGTALVETMYGKESPSGRLPYTVARKEEDYGSLLGPDHGSEETGFYSQSNFTEGLNIDYKHFIASSIKPRFAFGYGLTYTTFNYSGLSVEKNSTANISSLPPSNGTVVPQGGLESLYDTIATVTSSVENTGKVYAAEVAQLYVGIPGSGLPKVLRGFQKQSIEPGKTANMTFDLSRRDLSIWDTAAQNWRLPQGKFDVYVGKSVEDIQLSGTLQL